MFLNLLFNRHSVLFELDQPLTVQAAKGCLEVALPGQQVGAQARHHVLGGECLEREAPLKLHPFSRLETAELKGITGFFEGFRSLDQGSHFLFHGRRTEDPRRSSLVFSVVHPPLRQNKRQPQNVVEVAMRNEQGSGRHQLRHTPADIEGQARRLHPKPGLFTGRRRAINRESPEGERSGKEMTHGAFRPRS